MADFIFARMVVNAVAIVNAIVDVLILLKVDETICPIKIATFVGNRDFPFVSLMVTPITI